MSVADDGRRAEEGQAFSQGFEHPVVEGDVRELEHSQAVEAHEDCAQVGEVRHFLHHVDAAEAERLGARYCLIGGSKSPSWSLSIVVGGVSGRGVLVVVVLIFQRFRGAHYNTRRG